MPISPVTIPSPGALVAVALSALAAATPSSEPAGPEPQITPAVLYNSARFVTWPAEAFADRRTPLAVCVLGEDPFGPGLETFLADKTVQGRGLVVRRPAGVSDLRPCHLLFVGASHAPHLDRILAGAGRGVLTVSDIPRFAERGDMIGFVRESRRVGFEINTQAVRDADLAVSSRLLKLARVIR